MRASERQVHEERKRNIDRTAAIRAAVFGGLHRGQRGIPL
jgi:hypothetical protein